MVRSVRLQGVLAVPVRTLLGLGAYVTLVGLALFEQPVALAQATAAFAAAYVVVSLGAGRGEG